MDTTLSTANPLSSIGVFRLHLHPLLNHYRYCSTILIRLPPRVQRLVVSFHLLRWAPSFAGFSKTTPQGWLGLGTRSSWTRIVTATGGRRKRLSSRIGQATAQTESSTPFDCHLSLDRASTAALLIQVSAMWWYRHSHWFHAAGADYLRVCCGSIGSGCRWTNTSSTRLTCSFALFQPSVLLNAPGALRHSQSTAATTGKRSRYYRH